MLWLEDEQVQSKWKGGCSNGLWQARADRDELGLNTVALNTLNRCELLGAAHERLADTCIAFGNACAYSGMLQSRDATVPVPCVF